MSEPYQGRDLRHFPNAGISIGVDVRNETARVAICAVNFKAGDKFSRVGARRILNLCLDRDPVAYAMKLERNSVHFTYKGNKPRNEIVAPLVSRIEKELLRREKSKGKSGRITSILEVMREEAKQRQAYHHRSDGKLPGVGLNDAGAPTPAICPMPMPRSAPTTQEKK